MTSLKRREETAQERRKGFPGDSDDKEPAHSAGYLGSIPRSGRFSQRRQWQPTPVFLPGRIPRTEEPGTVLSMELQRVGYDWVSNIHTFSQEPCKKEERGMKYLNHWEKKKKSTKQEFCALQCYPSEVKEK